MTFRDIALTVLELEPDEFHWVLMEAVQAESEECLGYRPVDSSMRGSSTYTEALIEGASALRTLQGLAPFGKRPPVGRTFKLDDRAAVPTPPSETARSDAPAPRLPLDSDLASMFTGYHPR
ncbi:MAG: hypothetical protein EOP81_00185 [Variovorax sp.]|nr:MAG: hypothetical protein EOP81_00185 [Variovorax sp.]